MAGKKILGLDLGTNSIGWAKVIEGDASETSSIEKVGVRVNPLTTEEIKNFEKGKTITTNADRTLKRGMRRNLDRYQLRRDALIEVLKANGFLPEGASLAEAGKGTTHSTYQIRAQAATGKVEKGEIARVLLAINKKRGYKSSRKTQSDEEGKAIDGMAIAKRLYHEQLTPGQLAYQLLLEGTKNLPDFYRSDLQGEFDQVWDFQKQHYPDILTDAFYQRISAQGQKVTSAAFWTTYAFNTAENKGTRDEKKRQAYAWRSKATSEKLEKEEVAHVLADINNDLSKSSGYLGAISDRSKELYFHDQTVGQYLYAQLQRDPHTRLKNQVFYRQDYLDEFEKVWQVQARYHPGMTEELKAEIRDIIIFYQRKLKSQKGMIAFCEFESHEVSMEKNGKVTKKKRGLRVAPRSSPLFQEFKIWQILHNVQIKKKGTRKRVVKEGDTDLFSLDQEEKQLLFEELNIKGNLKAQKVLQILGHDPKQYELNYSELEGNHTQMGLYETWLRILEIEGRDLRKLLGLKAQSAEVRLEKLDAPATKIKQAVGDAFDSIGIDKALLDFNAELDGKGFEQQPAYQLWHLLYSYEGDESASGNEKLYQLLAGKYGFRREHAQMLAALVLTDDYGSLSTKAIRRIYPYIKELGYDQACAGAGYRHSAQSLTRQEIQDRPLKDKLELLKKNSLRNPVVEKILNQMIHVVNALVDEENDALEAQGKERNFHFDEIRIELARELKKNAKERAEMTSSINTAKAANASIAKLLQTEFGVPNPTRKDIIRYKLYEELKGNGYKDLYTNTFISAEALFTAEVDVDHIIPQSRLFDDSFSNKTLAYRQDNLDKGSRTAYDYIESRFGEEGLEAYRQRVTSMYERAVNNKSSAVSKAKYLKLLKRESEIGDGFIERDLRDSQYIAKKARLMLHDICRVVTPTSGSVTDRLRNDWGLVNVMKELNLPKYRELGLTEMKARKDGSQKEQIKDWTKRNDHRHHAMDALTVAFTKLGHIQYLNHLNARKDTGHKLHAHILGIENKSTTVVKDGNGNSQRIFLPPIVDFRAQAKAHLESVLVSHKAKNKVVTLNKNKIKTGKGVVVTPQLTPRGQLHKETVYGQYLHYVTKLEKIGGKFDKETIMKVAKPTYRQALLNRLAAFDDQPGKAFTGKNALSKNPIFLDVDQQDPLPEMVKLVWVEKGFSIRKEVTPENFKNTKSIEKVLDARVREKLATRLKIHGGDSKKAFSGLDSHPIWLDEKAGIQIKKVKISGVKNAGPLHYKKDHFGQELLDTHGQKIPVDFVSTGNNHHVAIYEDDQGHLQERVVSLLDAVRLVMAGLPVIDKGFNRALGWKFLFTMKQNECFVFPEAQGGFDPGEIDLLDPVNKKRISPHLFRVQKLATTNYMFRHHLETTVEEPKALKGTAFKNLQSTGGLRALVKVRINHLGDIVSVGEY